jgi:two-component sensor histidine kinase
MLNRVRERSDFAAKRHAGEDIPKPARLTAAAPVFIAALTLLAAFVTGFEVFRQGEAIALSKRERAFDEHANRLQNHLRARESIVRAVAATGAPDNPLSPNALDSFDETLLHDLYDVFSFVWAPNVPRSRANAVKTAIARAGRRPRILGVGGRVLPDSALTPRLTIVLAIRPATPANRSSIGLNLESLPAPREALARARAHNSAAATAPINLVQMPGKPAVVVYAPARAGKSRNIRGFIGMSFLYGPLIEHAVGADAGLAWVARDRDDPTGQILARSSYDLEGPPSQRAIPFAGRTLILSYTTANAPRTHEPLARALLAAGFVIAIGMTTLFVLQIVNRARMRAEKAETQLTVLVRELDHRVRNVLAVVTALVRQSLRAKGQDNPALFDRLNAFGAATSLLTQHGWTSARLTDLLAPMQNASEARVQIEGPDIAIKPQAAQNLSLAFHELWTNAVKHGALADAGGEVRVRWSIEDETFRLEWRERDVRTAQQTEPNKANGFGWRLLEQLAPRALSGTACVTFTENGLLYVLTAPRMAVMAA